MSTAGGRRSERTVSVRSRASGSRPRRTRSDARRARGPRLRARRRRIGDRERGIPAGQPGEDLGQPAVEEGSRSSMLRRICRRCVALAAQGEPVGDQRVVVRPDRAAVVGPAGGRPRRPPTSCARPSPTRAARPAASVRRRARAPRARSAPQQVAHVGAAAVDLLLLAVECECVEPAVPLDPEGSDRSARATRQASRSGRIRRLRSPSTLAARAPRVQQLGIVRRSPVPRLAASAPGDATVGEALGVGRVLPGLHLQPVAGAAA